MDSQLSSLLVFIYAILLSVVAFWILWKADQETSPEEINNQEEIKKQEVKICDYCDGEKYVSLGGTGGKIACPRCNRKK